jgi:hypothetical protein
MSDVTESESVLRPKTRDPDTLPLCDESHAPAPSPATGGKTLADLGRDDCRWIDGEPYAAIYCGEPVIARLVGSQFPRPLQCA